VLALQYKPENAEFAEKNGSFRSWLRHAAVRQRPYMPVLAAFLISCSPFAAARFRAA
jgi:hypothetical protein